MNILHVTKKYPDALGGDAVVVANLQQHQEAAGHEVAILTSNCDEIKNGPHIYKFGLLDTPAALDHITIRRLISLVALFFKAFRVFSRERPDVIHTHSIDMAFCVSFAARFYKIPLIHTFHIVTFYEKTHSLLRRKTELLFARLARPNVITAPNAHDVTMLKQAGLTQAVVLPNGVDLEFWQPVPNAKTKPKKNKRFTFVSIGRLEPQKGYTYLVRAAALLAGSSGQTFRIIVVGEGGQKEDLQKLVRSLNVEHYFEFAGRKTPTEVRELLSRADAAIFASLYETTPLTLLEAWAMGVPVIITPVGILRDAPPDTPLTYLVKPKDGYSLMTAMQLCMTDEVIRKQVAAAGQAEVKTYAWPDITKTIEKLYGAWRS